MNEPYTTMLEIEYVAVAANVTITTQSDCCGRMSIRSISIYKTYSLKHKK